MPGWEDGGLFFLGPILVAQFLVGGFGWLACLESEAIVDVDQISTGDLGDGTATATGHLVRLVDFSGLQWTL